MTPRYTVHLAPSGFTVVDGQSAGVVECDLQRAAQAVDNAYAHRDALIASALAQGWTQRAVADAVGLSHGRIGQLALRLGRRVVTWEPNE